MCDKPWLLWLALVVWAVPGAVFSEPAEIDKNQSEERIDPAVVRNGCVASHLIRRVSFDDDRTGTLELAGRQRIRLTLRAPCSGIRFNGYVHKPVNHRFCEGDTLRVMGSGGFCVVKTLEVVVPDDTPVPAPGHTESQP